MGDILQPGVVIRPAITEEHVKRLVKKLYGLKCSEIKELNGYDDRNFYVKVEECTDNEYVTKVCRDGYVFKIINSMESQKSAYFEAQNELLVYLGEKGIICPKPVKSISGTYYCIETLSTGNHIVRLFEFIPGEILHQIPVTENIVYQCGKYIAKLDNALKDFHHPGYNNYKTLWMLDSLPELQKFIFAVKDIDRKEIVREVVCQFENRVLSVRQTLASGLIHGDFNEQNVIVEKDSDGSFNISAVLDFGDSHVDCYLYELAITMTYLILKTGNLESGGHALAGYKTIRKVPEHEFLLLRVCVAARLCQSLVLGAYSSIQDPNNTYVLTTAKRGWHILEMLWSQPEEAVLAKWKNISESYAL